MRAFLLVTILFFQVGQCLATVLVVRKDGSSFWAESAKKQDGKLVHESGSVALDEVSQIIPKIKRGKQYPAATVDKIVGVIDKEMDRHPKLRKQLAALRDEWKELQTPAVDITADIAKLGQEYGASDRDLAAFTDFTTKLGMLKFRDLRGTFAEDITSLEGKVKGEFFARQHKQLMTQLRPKMSIDELTEARSLVKSLLSLGIDDARGDAISKRMEQARVYLLKSEMARAKTIISGNKLPAYTAANAIIFDLRERVAESAAHKATLEKSLTTFRANVAKSNRGIVFDDRGFPFTREDVGALDKYRENFSTMILFTEVEPRAFLFPRSLPGRIAFNEEIRVPLTAVLRALPPAGSKLGIAIHVLGPTGMVEHASPLPLQFIDARANINLAFDLRVAPEIVQYNQAQGKAAVYFSLACLPTGEDKWQMLSHACTLPMR